MAKCIDISEAGLRIESPQPIHAGSSIQLAADRIKLSGAATVKHQVRHGSKFLLGLQLTQAKLDKVITELEGRPVVTVLLENLRSVSQCALTKT